MANNKYLISLDLDGTLLDHNGKVSTANNEALLHVVDRGHTVIANTGRSRYSAVPVLANVPAITDLICSNGAYHYHQPTEKVMWTRTIEPGQIKAWLEILRSADPELTTGRETDCGLHYEEAFLAASGGPVTLEQGGDPEKIAHLPVIKLLLRTPTRDARKLLDDLLPLMGEHTELATSGAPFVEATAKGVNKATALAKFAHAMNIEQKFTIAFGDHMNDIPAIEWAGLGVAMGESIPEVLDVADRVTTSHSEDGVAVQLQKMLQAGLL